jgi:hypothetical protein
VKNSAVALLALSIVALTTGVAASEDAESALVVDAFLALCPAALEFADLERALAAAEASGRVTPDPERLMVVGSHQRLSARQQVTWEGHELELGWGAGPVCGIVGAWTSDYAAFSDTLSGRTEVTWEDRSGLFVEGRRNQERTYRSWMIERDGRRFEITSFLDANPADDAATQGFVTVGIGPVAQTRPSQRERYSPAPPQPFNP